MSKQGNSGLADIYVDLTRHLQNALAEASCCLVRDMSCEMQFSLDLLMQNASNQEVEMNYPAEKAFACPLCRLVAVILTLSSQPISWESRGLNWSCLLTCRKSCCMLQAPWSLSLHNEDAQGSMPPVCKACVLANPAQQA